MEPGARGLFLSFLATPPSSGTPRTAGSAGGAPAPRVAKWDGGVWTTEVGGARNDASDMEQLGLFDQPTESRPLREAVDFYQHERGGCRSRRGSVEPAGREAPPVAVRFRSVSLIRAVMQHTIGYGARASDYSTRLSIGALLLPRDEWAREQGVKPFIPGGAVWRPPHRVILARHPSWSGRTLHSSQLRSFNCPRQRLTSPSDATGQARIDLAAMSRLRRSELYYQVLELLTERQGSGGPIVPVSRLTNSVVWNPARMFSSAAPLTDASSSSLRTDARAIERRSHRAATPLSGPDSAARYR